MNKPDALKVALEFEEKGRVFYDKTARQSEDALSQKLFSTLAQDEITHAERIREIFQSLEHGGAWPPVSAQRAQSLEGEIHGFFNLHRQNLRKTAEPLEGYEFAMNLEKTGIEIYEKFSKETGNPQEKKFFLALIEEEKQHLEAIQNVYFFLSQTGDWNEQEESRRWNWMSL